MQLSPCFRTAHTTDPPVHQHPPSTILTLTHAGSDLVYEEHSPAQLSPLLQRLLQQSPGARVLMAHRHRRAELDASMEAALQSCGLRLETLLRTAGETCEVEDVSIYSITRA